MKKIILLSVLVLSKLVSAQYPVWTNSFNSTSDMQGWSFHDLNGNGNGWIQGPNIYYNGTSLAYGSAGSLRYSISNVPSGFVTGFATENDWAISPAIDLTAASGTITLAAYIGRQQTAHDLVSRYLYIYESTAQKPVPELSDFQALAVDAGGNQLGSPYYISAGGSNPFPADLTQFVESLVDLSAFAGKKIYIGLWSNRLTDDDTNVQNININEMAIYSSFLNTQDVKKVKNTTSIMQNPVTTSLMLKLNPALKENAITVNIINMAGQSVLTTQYNREINVAGLSSGNYIAVVSDGILSEKVKFIKK
ncbi:T9SS type A sorting domain-containing protein [Chryseobacterium sp. ISL-6]|uniref:T9SS-dependent choice-of-anchor J family protein n=1 Tax=Chryseobacterium sp. ISL-6 TaxID=2819143 RepID=UPI001BEB6231|nr:T9SS type A sorting domain-containing protein [Chryseobacterium sp. ISL-6]MBT2623562.1 T9SS type A sorting domain-containing protein [Chryseobacterium sp. ISL-6]